MVASAHKRCGAHDVAFHEYQKLHDKFPENIKALRCLVETSKTLGKSSFKYEDKLDRLLHEAQEDPLYGDNTELNIGQRPCQ